MKEIDADNYSEFRGVASRIVQGGSRYEDVLGDSGIPVTA